METILLAWNPETGRCHGVVPGCLALKYPDKLIRITRVPRHASIAKICAL